MLCDGLAAGAAGGTQGQRLCLHEAAQHGARELAQAGAEDALEDGEVAQAAAEEGEGRGGNCDAAGVIVSRLGCYGGAPRGSTGYVSRLG